MWELNHKKGWAPKNWCLWTVVLEKTLESPLASKEIKAVNPKGNQPWIVIGRTDAEAPILWQPDVKSRVIEKDPDAGKDWRQKEKEAAENEMVGWHHRLNGHEFEQTPGDGEGPGSLVSMGSQRVGHNLGAEQQQRVGGLLLAAPTSDSKFMATIQKIMGAFGSTHKWFKIYGRCSDSKFMATIRLHFMGSNGDSLEK